MTKIIDTGVDVFEFVTHDQADRTGIACARIARSLNKGVDPEALALQLSANERKNNPANPEVVTVEDVNGAAKLHRLNSRRQVYPKVQATELDKVARQEEDSHQAYQI